MILLARSAGEWWTHVHDESSDVQRLFRRADDADVVTELPSVATAERRRALFEAGLAAFWPLLAAQGVMTTGAPPMDYVKRIETGTGIAIRWRFRSTRGR